MEQGASNPLEEWKLSGSLLRKCAAVARGLACFWRDKVGKQQMLFSPCSLVHLLTATDH